MVKGDDARLKKKNKAARKKLQKDPSALSARVAGIIAAKKRRQSGKRRQCQGMCFSLPTPDDPYNDRQGKKDTGKKKDKKGALAQSDKNVTKKDKFGAKRNSASESDVVAANGKETRGPKFRKLADHDASSIATEQQGQVQGTSGCPSKFLVLCLKTIHDAFPGEDKQLFANAWGAEFWKFYSHGKDILETTGSRPTLQQIAWMISTAGDSISQKENEGVSFTSPFLLYLVPSQEDAVKVRSVCKPLKALGIHTVSLHSGASLDHQILGLKSCEPEFLAATPLRLWELVSLKAVDISGVSLLIMDGLDTLADGGCLDAVKGIKRSISKHPRMVVFQGLSSNAPAQAIKGLLKEPVHRLSVDSSTRNQNASIFQSVDSDTSEEEEEEEEP